MPQSKKKVEQLMDQYPFLREVGYWALKLDDRLAELDNVSVRIQRADPNLMFRQVDDVKGLGGLYLMDPSEPRKKGVRRECFYPVNREGQLGRSRPLADEQRYVRDLFAQEIWDWAMHVPGRTRADDPMEEISCVVWVTSVIWYWQEEDHDLVNNGEGEPVAVETEITVFQEPREGWRRLYIAADPLENVILMGSRLLSATPDDKFSQVVADRLHRLAMQFQDDLFDSAFVQLLHDAEESFSGMCGDAKLTVGRLAGSMAIGLRCGDVLVRFDGRDSIVPHLRLGDIYGTYPSVVELVERVIRSWRGMSEAERRAAFVGSG